MPLTGGKWTQWPSVNWVFERSVQPGVLNFIYSSSEKNKTKQNRSRVNVTVHIFLLKVVTIIIGSKSESEMLLDWPQEPAEEGLDWECSCTVTVTVTELGLKQQKHSTSRALERQEQSKNQGERMSRYQPLSTLQCWPMPAIPHTSGELASNCKLTC